MKSINQIAQAQSIQHLWNQGIKDAAEIQRRTGIPRSTIYYNLEKSGVRPTKSAPVVPRRLHQNVRKLSVNMLDEIWQYCQEHWPINCC